MYMQFIEKLETVKSERNDMSDMNKCVTLSYLLIPAQLSSPIKERTVQLNSFTISCDAAHYIPILLQNEFTNLTGNRNWNTITPVPTFNECLSDNVCLFFYEKSSINNNLINERAKFYFDLFRYKFANIDRVMSGDVFLFWRQSVDEAKHEMVLQPLYIDDLKSIEQMNDDFNNLNFFNIPELEPTSNSIYDTIKPPNFSSEKTRNYSLTMNSKVQDLLGLLKCNEKTESVADLKEKLNEKIQQLLTLQLHFNLQVDEISRLKYENAWLREEYSRLEKLLENSKWLNLKR